MVMRSVRSVGTQLVIVATVAVLGGLGWQIAVAQSVISPPVNLEPASFPKLYNTLPDSLTTRSFPVAVLDINGDEMMDVFVGQGEGRNDLIAIQHHGKPWSVHSLDDDTQATHGALAVDVNRDFIDDLVITRHAGVFVYIGRERGGFGEPVRLPDSDHDASMSTRQVIAADVNNDGWMDLYAVRGAGSSQGANNRLWINLGVSPKAHFREAAVGAGVEATGDNVAAVFADFDDDGFTDLVVSASHGEPRVFRNEGNGNFEQADTKLPILDDVVGMSATDVDQDGDIDLLMTISPPRPDGGLLFFKNDGGFVLTDATSVNGLTIRHGVSDAVWVDLNNDGHRDLLATGITTDNEQHSFAMVQQHDGEFQHVPLEGFFDKVPAFWVVSDFNRDGVVDMLGVPLKGEIALRHGSRFSNNWLGIKLRGRDNRAVSGATVLLRMADGTHFHHRYGAQNYANGAVDRELMFGLGRRSEISMLEINWPSGKYTRVDTPEFNRHLGFVEPKGEGKTADLSIRHNIVSFVESRRRARRENPDIQFGKSQEQFVCR